MPDKFARIWISGEEALRRLSRIAKGKPQRFRLLQEAIRANRILGRWRAREGARHFWISMGLAGDPDYVPQVDDAWRRRFIYVAPESVDLTAFGMESELLREDLIEYFNLQVSAPDLSRRQLKPAPDHKIHEAIVKVYDAADQARSKPPNLRELPTPAQKILEVWGYKASAKRIEELGGDPRHDGRRRPPGRTVASERSQ